MIKITQVKNPTTQGITRDYVRERTLNPNYDKDLKSDIKKIGKEAKKYEKKKTKFSGFKGSFFKKKILGRPKGEVPSYNPKKVITKGLVNEPLVREGEEGWFKKEYSEESKWLS